MLKRKSIPNALTYLRMMVIPLFIGAAYLPLPQSQIILPSLFVLASISDFLDGYLARKWQVVSEIGRALDPVADKLLVAVALLVVMQQGHAPMIAVAIILCRELWVAGLREALAGRSVVHVSVLAKWKTATQMVAITLLLLAWKDDLVLLIGQLSLWLSVALTLITGWGYSRASLPLLRG